MTPEDVGRLLSLISHEVRAPIGVMRGYLRLLDQQGAGLSDQQRHAVAAALRAGDRATQILSEISALGQLHRGDTEPVMQPVSLEPLLRSAAAGVLPATDPAVTVQVGDTPAFDVLADEELLRSALTSLTAAVVRAQASDASVQLRAYEQTIDGARGVAVTIGVMGRRSPALAEAPLDAGRGGLGLQLPVAAWVIDAHRGRIHEQRDGSRLLGVVLWMPLA